MREPTAIGGAVSHSIDLMFSYQAVALPGSEAKAATSSRGRAMSISLRTSTGMRPSVDGRQRADAVAAAD